MGSLVLDLQQELLQADCDVLIALRKAHVIATKLKLSEFNEWIQNELNGYKCNYNELPGYRKVAGSLKAWNPYRGWIPCIISDKKVEELICTAPIYDGIAIIKELGINAKSGTVLMQFNGQVEQQIISMLNMPVSMNVQLHVSTTIINGIPEAVKNYLLQWTLDLETQGILGENMTFTKEERETARETIPSINNYFGTVVNGDISQSQVVSGRNYAFFDKETIAEIRKSIETEIINTEEKETAFELLDDISEKVVKEKKPKSIKASAKALGGFLKDVGATVTAELIMSKLGGKF